MSYWITQIMLGDPRRPRVRRATREVHAPRPDLEEEERVQRLEEERLNREEVAGQHAIAVSGEELPPGA